MARLALGFTAIAAAAAVAGCGLPRPADLPEPRQITGRLHGLWDGADGVSLRLQADGVDTLLTVSANGPFAFDPVLAPGVSYTVTVVSSPAQHTCTVASGGNGTVPESVPTTEPEASIACAGPAGAIALSGLWGWTFDRTEEHQVFAGSVAVQDVALTIGGDGPVTAMVQSVPVVFGQPTPKFPLGLGSTTLTLALTATGGLSKTYQLEFQRAGAVLEQVVYGKASNTFEGMAFGVAIAIEGDTLAVGALSEASKATGVNGDQTDRTAPSAGAVYVFVRGAGGGWTQQAYLKASNTNMGDNFGTAVALSGDTLVVGASGEQSNSQSNPADNSLQSAGAVYVFVRSAGVWTFQAYLKAPNPDEGDVFGYSVAVSGDTLAAGAFMEASAATGVNTPGGQQNNDKLGTGAVYVFTRKATAWTLQAYVKPSNDGGYFGSDIALDGDTLAVGAPNEDSGATGINSPDQFDSSKRAAGAVYVFVRTNQIWMQQAYIKASNTGEFDDFGRSVALSGNTLAVGASQESSAARGVDPGEAGQADDTAGGAGAAYVFVRDAATWRQQAYLKASNTGAGDGFGWSVAVSGNTLVVGAQGESSNATGVDGNQDDDSALVAGAAYVFGRAGEVWSQHGYVKASNAGSRDQYGAAVAVSADAVVVGAWSEDGAGTGTNSDRQGDNSAMAAGAIYLYR